MKKLLLTILLAWVSLAAVAQSNLDPRVFNNQFFSLGGGMVMYNNYENIGSGFGGDITYGNWVTSDLAVRLQLGMAMAGNARNLTSSFLNGHIDVMWDAISTISGANDPRRVVSVYPMIGIGVLARQAFSEKPENAIDSANFGMQPDFFATFGAQVLFRIPGAESWPLFVEGKCIVMSQNFDFNEKVSNLWQFGAGIQHDINYDPSHKRLGGEARTWGDEWFFGVSAGPDFTVMQVANPDELTTTDRLRWNFDVTVGRNVTCFWTARLGMGFIHGTAERPTLAFATQERGYEYGILNIHGDLMFNVLNIGRLTPYRRISVLPYVGTGFAHRIDRHLTCATGDAGILLRWYLGKYLDFTLDGRYVVMPSCYAGTMNTIDLPTEQDRFGNGYALLNLGVTYNFPNSRNRYRDK